MGELSIHSDGKFNEQLDAMTTQELQNLLWQLEDEQEKLKRQREAEIKAAPEKDRLGNLKPAESGWTERGQLNSRILKCREKLLDRLYTQAAEKSEEYTPITQTRWAIIEKKPVTILADKRTDRVYWEKHGGDAPVQQFEKITIAECGDFCWSSNPQISTVDMFNGITQIPFTVPSNKTDGGRVEVNIKDIKRGLEEVQQQYLELKLAKVNVQGEEVLEYFMLMSIPTAKCTNDNQKRKLEQFLLKTYTSNAHQAMLRAYLKKGKGLFGGIVSQDENGNLALSFDDRYIQAIGDANNFKGICKTLSGEKKVAGSLLDAIDILNGTQKRRETLEALERSEKGIEDR